MTHKFRNGSEECPQGLKPVFLSSNVGAKAPTPKKTFQRSMVSSFGSSAVRVNTETVYSGHCEAGVVMTSVSDYPTNQESAAKLRYICALVTKSIHTITLGMQTSGDDDRTGEHVVELRKLLAAYCNGPYSDEIAEFALVLRVGGKMQEFDFEGCERIRRNRKGRYITVDLGFPSRKWRGVSDSVIRGYLADIVETGLLCTYTV